MTEAYASGDPTTMALVDYANVKTSLQNTCWICLQKNG